MELSFRRRARSDLREIGFYTADRWGGEQADRYLASIRTAIAAAVKKPDGGYSFDGAASGTRYVRSGRHLIFYRVRGDMFIVLAVLHERMDLLRHIG